MVRLETVVNENRKDSLLWQGVGYRCHTQQNVTASVKTGEIENSPVKIRIFSSHAPFSSAQNLKNKNNY